MERFHATPHYGYTGRLLAADPTIDQIRTAAYEYIAILLSVITHVVDRYERSPYPGLIDTKFSIATGEEFPLDDVRGPGTVYGWIQGRGLEALVGHVRWIAAHPWCDPTGSLTGRLKRMIAEVHAHLQAMRRRNDGRLFFFMDPTGEPFEFTPDGSRRPHRLDSRSPYNFSDLFGSRGLFAASTFIGDPAAVKEATAYCLAVEEALWDGRFESDQRTLPPVSKRTRESPKPHSHAPFTIMLATPSLIAMHTKDVAHIRRGVDAMRHVIERHLNLGGQRPELRPYDFWEFTDREGKPYVQDGRLISDPGHTLEFVGLGLKLTRTGHKLGLSDSALDEVEAVMPELLEQSFANGFASDVGGICKSVDLLTREPIDATMPWWSLPESMRAAIECWAGVEESEAKKRALRIFAACHNAFLAHYVLPERHLFAIQARSGTGEVVDVIPATADADPGYHTGLSLIDVLDVIEEETGPLQPAAFGGF